MDLLLIKDLKVFIEKNQDCYMIVNPSNAANLYLTVIKSEIIHLK